MIFFYPPLCLYYIKMVSVLHEWLRPEAPLFRAILRPYMQPCLSALLNRPTSEPYLGPYSAALPCLALQGASSPLARP